MKKAVLTFSLVGGLGSQLHKYLLAEALCIELNAHSFYELGYFYENSRKIKSSDPSNRLTRGFDLGNLCPQLTEVTPQTLTKCRGAIFHYIITRWPRILGHIRAPYVIHLLNLGNFFTNRHIEYFELFYGNPAPRSASKIRGLFFYFYGEPGINLDLIELHRDTLQAKLDLEGWLSQRARNLMDEISGNRPSIFIHVRRGDQPSPDRLTVEYYRVAISNIRSRINRPSFYIFSDDIDWARTHILPLTSSDALIVEGLNVDEDFVAMSKCQHGILANSGFSYMASWLGKTNESIYLVPKRWWANSERNNIHLAELPDYLELIDN